MRETVGLVEHLVHRHDDGIRVTPEAREREDFPADPALARLWSRRIDHTRYLIADNRWQLGRIRVQALAREDVREIDAAGAHADAQLPPLGLRIRRLAKLKLVGASRANDENLFHDCSPNEPKAARRRKPNSETREVTGRSAGAATAWL